MPKKTLAATGATIGQLGQAAGVNVETIRYYQRIGLLCEPARSYGSFRRYSPDDLKRVRFIKRAQALGFSLKEVSLLLELSDGRHCAETRELAEKKLEMVRQKITDLASMQSALTGLVAQCGEGSRGRGCPIIDALARDGN